MPFSTPFAALHCTFPISFALATLAIPTAASSPSLPRVIGVIASVPLPPAFSILPVRIR